MQIHVSPEINSLLDDAATISIRRGKYFVGVEHLFEAVLEQSADLPKPFTDKYLRDLATVLQTVQRKEWKGASPTTGEVFYTPRCADVAHNAGRFAQRLNSASADAGHVLLALLSDAHAIPSRTMHELGMNRGDMIEVLRERLKRDQNRIAPAPQGGSEASVAVSQNDENAPGDLLTESGSLVSLTRDLTAEAKLGFLDPAIGRDKQMFQVMEILGRKGKSNAILVGEAGVGKTRIVEGIAVAAARGKLGAIMENVRILELKIGSLLAGTQYRGALEERLSKLLDELENEKDAVLFIDEIHLIMGAGTTEGGGVDVANMLKPVLARGTLRCVGATTIKEYRKFIEKDPAVERRFQVVKVEPLSETATLDVLTKLRPTLEGHHHVHISRKTLAAAVSLSNRYVANRQLPDIAVDVLDQACARHRLKTVMLEERGTLTDSQRRRPGVVTPHDIRKVISQITAIPLEELTAADRQRLDNLERRLKKRIVGQDEAVARAVTAVKKSRAGLADPKRPDATMLFLGPTGVGKTQLAKELADDVFGSPDHLVTFDMSEYIEEHAVSRLLGAPPGYKGSDEEGRLARAVRNNPYSILLFDEIEKAHPRIFDLFLPIFDEGRLKDNQGREIDFRNTIIILTSNVGSELLFSAELDDVEPRLLDELTHHFRPEFINRIDEIVPFYPLLFEDVRAILRMQIDELRRRLAAKNIGIRMYQGAYEFLAEEGYDPRFGARNLRRAVDRFVVAPLSDKIIRNEFAEGVMIDILIENGELAFRPGAPHVKTEYVTR